VTDPGGVVRSTERVPGLDGLRGLALGAVVVFHAWPHLLPGGFLGVSFFFTLSGYLITSLLLRELAATGTIDLRAFWGRRVRRLVPAAAVCIGGVSVAWSLAGWLDRTTRLDALAGIANWSNWRLVAEGQPYGAEGARPLLHLWSLAIEEQSYVAVPVLATLARSRARLAVGLGALGALSVVATLTTHDRTVAYYATSTRAAELLAGCLAAIALPAWRRPAATRVDGRAGGRGALAWLVAGTLSLGLLARWCRTTSLSDESLHRGGLLGVALVSALAVVAVSRAPALGRALDAAPLAAVGRASYGAYLYHWPILCALRRSTIDPPLQPWCALVGTAAATWCSYVLVERPLREGRWRRLRPALPLAVATGGAALLVTLLVPVSATAAPDFDAALERSRVASRPVPAAVERREREPASAVAPAAAPAVGDAATPATSAAPATAAPGATRPVRFATIGDSTALALGLGMIAPGEHRLVEVVTWTELGCPAGRGGLARRDAAAPAEDAATGCDHVAEVRDALAASGPVDVALVAFGSRDAQDRRVAALGDGWHHLGQPAYDAWLLEEMARATDSLVAGGVARVAWLTLPERSPVLDEDRSRRYDELLRELAAARPGVVRVIELGAWLATTGEAERLLPDGIHATWEPDGGTAREIGERFLVGEIIAAASP